MEGRREGQGEGRREEGRGRGERGREERRGWGRRKNVIGGKGTVKGTSIDTHKLLVCEL